MLRRLSLVLLFAAVPLAAHNTPTINAVVSAAGVAPHVSPGSIATVWGLDFAYEARSATTLPLPIQLGLGNTKVKINGVDCPLFYASEFQINLQIPFETPTDIEVVLLVEHDGLTSEPFKLTVRKDAISIFTYERVPASGQFEPVVLHSNGAALVTPQNPAKPGEVLVIYATGFGPLLNGPLTGNPAPAPPADWLTAAKPPAIYSTNQGGFDLTVHYSGLAADYVGLWQLNIQMPPTVPAGESGALRVTLPNSFQSIQFPFAP